MGGLLLSMVPPMRGDERKTWQGNCSIHFS